MNTPARFKFLIVNYIEQYTQLEGEDLLEFAVTYASLLDSPADHTLRQNIDILREAVRTTKIGYLFDTDHMTAFLSPDQLFIQAVCEVAENEGYTIDGRKLDAPCTAQPH